MATKTAKGFGVLCVKCGDPDAVVSLNLNNLQEVECRSCGETYSAREAAESAAESARRWLAVARWVEMAV
jgi:Zn ribbon nucleic-acid-binding protein